MAGQQGARVQKGPFLATLDREPMGSQLGKKVREAWRIFQISDMVGGGRESFLPSGLGNQNPSPEGDLSFLFFF